MKITKELFNKLSKRKKEEYKKEIDEVVNSFNPKTFLLINLNQLSYILFSIIGVLFLGLPFYYLAFSYSGMILIFIIFKYLILISLPLSIGILMLLTIIIMFKNIKKMDLIKEKYFKIEVKN